MKRSLKKLVIWLAAIMAASFGIAAVILVITGNFSVATDKINDSKTFSPEEISEIIVDITSADLNIIPSEEGDIIVHFYGDVSTNVKRNIPELVAYKTGSRLYVETHQSRGIFIGVNIQRITMDIYVPRIQLERMKLKTVSGDIILEKVQADRFEAETTSGEIKAGELYTLNIRARSTSGDITISDYSGNIDAGSTSGDLSVTEGNENEEISLATVSGDVLVEQDRASDMDIKTTSGDVKIKLSEDEEFNLEINTVSGRIRHDFPLKISSSGRRNLEGSVGDSDRKISVRTVSGDIVVYY